MPVFQITIPLDWEPSTECFTEMIVDGCFAGSTYTETFFPGLGGPYWNECYAFGYQTQHELVYYKKGNKEVGTPFILDISANKKEIEVSIYPNPANNYINIKASNNEILNNSFLEIYDMRGIRLLCKEINHPALVDVSSLASGFYMIKLVQQNKKIVFLKMLKQ